MLGVAFAMGQGGIMPGGAGGLEESKLLFL